MGIFLEFVVSVIGVLIYGTEDRPRPAILRNTVRFVALGGALLAFCALLGVLDLPAGLTYATPIWVLGLLIVLMVEHELGRTSLSIAALFAGAAVVVAAIAAGF